MTPLEIMIPLEGGRQTTAIHYERAAPAEREALLVLAHGAGAGQQHPFMTSYARALAARGIHVVTFNFPYMEQRRRAPDRAPVLESCFRSVITTIMARDALRYCALLIGGKSMGGRMATHLAAQGVSGLRGVIVFGYPLHPPGKPEQLRVAHFPAIPVPLLIVQGEHDAFGTPAELQPAIETIPSRVTLHVVEGADHSLAVKGVGPEETQRAVVTAVLSWSELVRDEVGPP